MRHSEHLYHCLKPAGFCAYKTAYRLRKLEKRNGEDDRDYSGCIDLDGECAASAAHSSACHLARILYRKSSFSIVYLNYKDDNDEKKNKYTDYLKYSRGSFLAV